MEAPPVPVPFGRSELREAQTDEMRKLSYAKDTCFQDVTRSHEGIGDDHEAERRIKSEMRAVMKKQEAHWCNVTDVIETLDRRLTLAENELLKLEDRFPSNAGNHMKPDHSKSLLEDDPASLYTSIYFSPIFEEKKKAGRANIGPDDISPGLQLATNHSKVLEVKELKAEIRCLRLQLVNESQSSSERHIMPSEKENFRHCFTECSPHGFMKVMKEKMGNTKKSPSLSVVSQGAAVTSNKPTESSMENKLLERRLPTMEHAETALPDVLAKALKESVGLKVCLESTRQQYENEVNKNKLLLQRIEKEETLRTTLMKEHQVQLERKDKTLSFAQELNAQLTNDMAKTETALAESRSYYKGLVASLESQLSDTKCNLENHQQTVDKLDEQLANSEAQTLSLEHALKDRDKQMEDFKRRMLAIQNETDATVIEKFDLITKMQALEKEHDAQNQKMADLVSVNEKLLKSVQSKQKLAFMDREEEIVSLQTAQTNTDEVSRLKQELDQTQKELRAVREEDEVFKQHYKLMKAKLCETEYELIQREEALERLTKHLAAVVGASEKSSVSEESFESLWSDKDQKIEEQFKHSQRNIIDVLEEKMLHMEAEVFQAKRELEHMKASSVEDQKENKENQQDTVFVKELLKGGIHEKDQSILDANGNKNRLLINIKKNAFPVELHPFY